MDTNVQSYGIWMIYNKSHVNKVIIETYKTLRKLSDNKPQKKVLEYLWIISTIKKSKILSLWIYKQTTWKVATWNRFAELKEVKKEKRKRHKKIKPKRLLEMNINLQDKSRMTEHWKKDWRKFSPTLNTFKQDRL